MGLDTATLFISLAISQLTAAGILVFFISTSRHKADAVQQACLLWSACLVSIALGSILIAMRGQIPDALSIGLANTLIVSGTCLKPVAVMRFFGKRCDWRLALLPGIAWLVLYQLPDFSNSAFLRVAYVHTFTASTTALTSVLAFTLNREKLNAAYGLGLASCLETLGYLHLLVSFTAQQFPEYINSFQSLTMNGFIMQTIICFTISSVMILAMAIERTQNKFLEQAKTDGLTGLANRRAFYQEAERFLNGTAAVTQNPYCVVLIDLDHFKKINDRFGHSAGDKVLEHFGKICGSHLPPDTLIGRIGGEEFAAVIPNSKAQETLQALRNLAEGLAEFSSELGSGELALSFSAGVVRTRGGTDIGTTLSAADSLLYQAKNSGRDRVELSDLVEAVPGSGGLLLAESRPA
ncbi:GGDEF domain-containing protein [Roseibium denhamense]|uniref:diguanylate cyclase n=1 Tax=Roseibium denhamense TaxID=76305 RepID=A0ABY1NT22_9HYPH|nr:GGDEF domain-containing protein [Roseibium denhamense]MTI05343.1 GGDEF domain-containing protein [Roseibium denhamense]SMP17236.1 diguanylate cyclase (GGDEF) domain-containing protein [Roseibium denhamense]